VSGINLLVGSQELEATMKSKLSEIEKVTHVYYLGKKLGICINRMLNHWGIAYKQSPDYRQEIKDAHDMLSRAVTAVDHLSPVLEFVVLQLGKSYRLLWQK
jgi:hypothetical protein